MASRNMVGSRRCKRRKHICWNCFNSMLSKEALENHISWCHLNGHQRIKYPHKGDNIHFVSGYKSSQVPFVIFYDFESLQKSVDKPCSCDDWTLTYTQASDEKKMAMEHDNSLRRSWEGVKRPQPLKLCPHKTRTTHTQTPFAYHIIVVSREGKVIDTRAYVGEDAGSKFCDDMLDLDEILTAKMEDVLPMKLSAAEVKKAKRTHICYLCDLPMAENDRARDHDHLTGKFLGVAHNICNLKRRELKKVVAFSHNFSG